MKINQKTPLDLFLSELISLASDIPNQDSINPIQANIEKKVSIFRQIFSGKSSSITKKSKQAIEALIEILFEQKLILGKKSESLKEEFNEILKNTNRNPEADLKKIRDAIEIILEAQNNHKKVADLMVRNAKLVPTLEGRNLIPVFQVELFDPSGRSSQILSVSSVRYFSLLNLIARDLQNNKSAIDKDGFIERFNRLEIDINDPLKKEMGKLRHAKMPKYFSFLKAHDQEFLINSYLEIFKLNNNKPISSQEHWYYALKFEKMVSSLPDFSIEINTQSLLYLDSKTRKDYQIEFRNGLLYLRDQILDTTHLKSRFKEDGTMAFVLSRDGDLYVNHHESMVFHHSSFLSGDISASSGMIKVEKGKVVRIDNVSGHYQPNEDEMVRVVKAIPQECFLTPDLNDSLKTNFTYVVTDFTPENTRKIIADLVASGSESDFHKTYWAVAFEGGGRTRLYPIIVEKLPEGHQETEGVLDGNMKIVEILTVYDLVQEAENRELEMRQKKEAQMDSIQKPVILENQDSPSTISTRERKLSQNYYRLSKIVPKEKGY